MSFDLFVLDIPPSVQHIDDMPKDFRPKVIGHRSEIISVITEVAPRADFSDPSYGHIDGSGWSIDVVFGESEEVSDFCIQIYGGGDEPLAVVAEILKSLKLRAFNPGSDTGLFEPGQGASETFRRWQQFRDQCGSLPP